MKIKRRPGKPGAGKLEKVPARRKAGGCEEGSSKKKLKAKPKESLRAAVTGGPSSAAPPSACSLFGAADPRHFGAREDGARLASERLKKATRKSKVLQSALRVSARLWVLGPLGVSAVGDGRGTAGCGGLGYRWGWEWQRNHGRGAYKGCMCRWGTGGTVWGWVGLSAGTLPNGSEPPVPALQRKNGALSLALSPRSAKTILSKGKKLGKVKSKVASKQVSSPANSVPPHPCPPHALSSHPTVQGPGGQQAAGELHRGGRL